MRFASLVMMLGGLAACRGDGHAPPADDAAPRSDASAADAPPSGPDATSCDARLGAKQRACGFPESLAAAYRSMYCGMEPSSRALDCVEALTCDALMSEIHQGRFPCVAD